MNVLPHERHRALVLRKNSAERVDHRGAPVDRSLERVAQRARKREFAKSNEAWRLAQVGEVLAMFLVGSAIVKNCVTGAGVLRDVRWAGAYGLLGVVLVLVVVELSTRTLFRAKLAAELERNNMAA